MSNSPRLLEKYRSEIVPSLTKEFGYKTVMAVPRVMKVSVNVGMGRFAVAKDTKMIERISQDIMKITGQKPVSRQAKQSIAGFKTRQGLDVGMSVTLRGRRMYDFIDRLISLALPRTRDFQGLPRRNIDDHGNLNIGIREHNVFPEIAYESLKDIFGLQITMTTTAKTQQEGISLFTLLGFPLQHG